jgi:hypothetical protein
MGSLPPVSLLFAVAGLGLTLAGFSGLVTAFHRGAVWEPTDAFRRRQIPEMGLFATLLALITGPLADTIGSATWAIRIAAAIGLAFTLGHSGVLLVRVRRNQIKQTAQTWIGVLLINLTIYAVAVVCIVTGGAVAYEWLLIALLARPMFAFTLVLAEVSTDGDPSLVRRD